MKWLALVAAGVVAWRVVRVFVRRRSVTPAWLIDNERRTWGTGVEQSSIRSWPIQKDEW